tara:strand:- start:1031 stop:1693 length:663 start_codon:yes stop_codon:yes gene_type:complete
MNLTDYKTLVFDCDGVLLNSNRVKTEAFRQAALPYGVAAANALVAYHVANGGISRYAKFAYFLDHIVANSAPNVAGPNLQSLLESYAAAAKAGLMECAVADGLNDLRQATSEQNWLIVSGGDQTELREIFAARGLDHLFNSGIFGSPDSKDVILEREQANGTIADRALFLGDSTYDYRAASGAGLDFVFVSRWSEVKDWETYVQTHGLRSVSTLWELFPT